MVQRGNTPDQFFSSVVTANKNRIETLKDVYKAVSVLKKSYANWQATLIVALLKGILVIGENFFLKKAQNNFVLIDMSRNNFIIIINYMTRNNFIILIKYK